MSTRSIRTTYDHQVCDVCERTLLRGEHPEVFVNGGRRYSVCELCKQHALQEGWIREGTAPAFAESGGDRDRRRSLFGRRRGRNSRPPRGGEDAAQPEPPQTLDEELSLGDWPRHAPPLAPSSASQVRESGFDDRFPREPRHVHAIPTSEDHKIVAAIESFNRSEHRRTIAGVARSLGTAAVNVTPDGDHASLVWIVVSWELCWYRYEVDLSVARSSVRLAGQGYELEELEQYEQYANAIADDSGALMVA
jgi:hypothetical protein